MTDEEIARLSAPARSSRGLSDEDVARMAAAPAASFPTHAHLVDIQAAPAKPEEPGFFARASESIKAGAHSVGHVIAQSLHDTGQRMAGAFGLQHEQPPTREEAAARIRELTRGADDMITLGHGQKFAARVGNALGDSPEEALGPETFSGRVAANSQAADAALAPDYRTTGQIVGTFTPGASSLIGKGVGKVIGKALPASTGGTIRQLLTGALRGVAGYRAAAPVAAALSANAEGDRVGAALDAMNDPAGNVLATVGGALGEAGGHAVARSKGAAARRFIEQHGGEVGPTTAGSGKVFDTMDVPGTSDADIGEQARLSGERVQPGLAAYRTAVATQPYLDELSKISPQQAGGLVDVRPIYSDMSASRWHPRTEPNVRQQLIDQLHIMDQQYTRANGDILMPEEHLNGLRATLGSLAGVGNTTDPSMAPLRRAYGTAKALVDQGPYADANKAFAQGSADADESMKHLGLRRSYSTAAPESDINKLAVKAQRAGQNTVTAGRDVPGMERFAAKHPALALELQRPALLRAKGDLSFRLQQSHGGLIDRTGSAMGAAATAATAMMGGGHYSLAPLVAMLALQNRDPINGRLLYPLRNVNAATVGGRLGAASAARGRKEDKNDRIIGGED